MPNDMYNSKINNVNTQYQIYIVMTEKFTRQQHFFMITIIN